MRGGVERDGDEFADHLRVTGDVTVNGGGWFDDGLTGAPRKRSSIRTGRAAELLLDGRGPRTTRQWEEGSGLRGWTTTSARVAPSSPGFPRL